jgi:hypothetical protein
MLYLGRQISANLPIRQQMLDIDRDKCVCAVRLDYFQHRSGADMNPWLVASERIGAAIPPAIAAANISARFAFFFMPLYTIFRSRLRGGAEAWRE